MKATISQSNVKGTVSVPASKSMTIRALMCAALSSGESEIIHPLVCDDTDAAILVLSKLGTIIKQGEDLWKVTGGKFRIVQEDLFCGESATTYRFLTAISSLIPGTHKLTGGPSLSARPIGSLVDALVKLGVNATMERAGFPPVVVQGGSFKGGATEIPGNVSSQFISALLLIAPFSTKGVSIKLTTPLTSKPYVLMTLWSLKHFGINIQREGNKFIVLRQRYTPIRIRIESDWSSAAYFLALGAMSKEGILIQNMNQASLQGDRTIVDILRAMGANIRVYGNNVIVSFGKLKGINADLSDCIDLLPTVAMLASLAKGRTELIGIQRARIKESNRVAAVREALVKLGNTVIEDENRLVINGNDFFKVITEEDVEDTEDEEEAKAKEKSVRLEGPVTLNSYGDHRLAMAFGVLGAATGDIIIDGAECVTKTFPTFWDEFQKVGGQVQIDE
jgi:3-phosphoshikimate 1-carboxyvinyltransferase